MSALTQNFTDNFFPRITISGMVCFGLRNALGTAVADAGDGAGIAELRSSESPREPAQVEDGPARCA